MPRIKAEYHETKETAPSAKAKRRIWCSSPSWCSCFFAKEILTRRGEISRLSKIPLVIIAATINILTKNFGDWFNISACGRYKPSPLKTMMARANQITWEKVFIVSTSSSEIRKSFKNLKKNKSEIVAPPKPSTTPKTCKIVTSILCSARRETNPNPDPDKTEIKIIVQRPADIKHQIHHCLRTK